ncbi:hypothetical protein S40288_08328 [Stachybotrys chartarum IBT 40288]|nr:hypothetical protein S40288_08328 [Stachybotrys chartarum IBT 40288]
MAAIAAAPPALSPTRAGGADPEDSNMSSPLSDVDDKDANDEDIEHMQLDAPDADNSSPISEDNNLPANDGSDSDSDSVLSEANSDVNTEVNSDGNDTEAETERLYDTPQIQRQRDVVVDEFNQGKLFEFTPSKLRRTTATGDMEENDEDIASIASSPDAVDESPTKPTISKPSASTDEAARSESHERKRKRSPPADTSESEQPLRKRTASIPASAEDIGKVVAAADENNIRTKPKARSQPAILDVRTSPRKRDAATEDEANDRETRASRKATRNGPKRRGADTVGPDTAGPEPSIETQEETRDTVVEDDAEQHDEEIEAEAEAEDEADVVAKNLEELEKKQAAYKDWTSIEEMFCIFRDRLYTDRLQRLEEEERSLLADEPTHPEYLNMKRCLDDRLNRKIQQMNNEYELRINAHKRAMVAQRAQIWGQYFQAVRETREHSLEALNKEWYEVQSARRGAHSLPDYGLLFPKDPAQNVRNTVAYNTEVSALAGMAKYRGFPAGPEMKGASPLEMEDDLNAMERFRRGRQKPIVHPRDEYQAPAFNRLGPAGEQFLKDTPWANPNHSVHKLYPGTTSQPDSRPELQSMGAARLLSEGFRQPPVDVKANAEALGGPTRFSESPEMSRSILNPAAHHMKRVKSIPSIGRGSKAAAA